MRDQPHPPPPQNGSVLPPSPEPRFGRPPQQKRSWFARNWGWVLGCGCLSVILVIVGIVALVFGLSYSMLKDNPVRKLALQQAQNSPEARELLGTPMECSVLFTGNISVKNSTGNADIAIPVSGPKGKGTLRVKATRSGGQWTLQSLILEVPGKAPVNLPARPEPEALEAPQEGAPRRRRPTMEGRAVPLRCSAPYARRSWTTYACSRDAMKFDPDPAKGSIAVGTAQANTRSGKWFGE